MPEMEIETGKDKKIIHMISGLPRSGSTLACNIFFQNPRFHASATSGLLEILFTIRNRICELQQFQAMKEEELDKKSVQMLRGTLQGYYQDVDRPVIFDKSRAWESFAEMAEKALGDKPKIICFVRDVRAVLASFEKLWRITSATRQLPDDKFNSNIPQSFWAQKTVEGRCINLLQSNGGVIGVTVTSMTEAIYRGWRKSIKFVDYEDLCSDPDAIIREIYSFIEEDYFKHDFEHIEQVTYENDLVWVYAGLHKIRPKIEPAEKEPWAGVIPEETIDKLLINGKPLKQNAKFWEDLAKQKQYDRVKPVRPIQRSRELEKELAKVGAGEKD